MTSGPALKISTLLILCLTLTLAACGGIEGKNYQTSEPAFKLFEFFDGRTKAWGIVQGRDGNILQRFDVDIIGTVSGQTLTLDETFSYAVGDGPEKRVWTIEDQGNGTYEGTAGDILKTAKGKDFGNAFYWSYRMDLPVGNTSYRVSFKDWIWALDNRRIINRSYIKKFGITFAEVTIFMEKQ